MTQLECRRCSQRITFENGRAFNGDGTIHNMYRCVTVPGHCWCPECNERFPQNSPCRHYRYYGYVPGNSEEFHIRLIIREYVLGSSLMKKRRVRRILCRTCNAELQGLTPGQRNRHRDNHEKAQSQYVLDDFTH